MSQTDYAIKFIMDASINLKKAIEATENTEKARVSRKITGHPNGGSVKARNLLFFLCDLCG